MTGLEVAFGRKVEQRTRLQADLTHDRLESAVRNPQSDLTRAVYCILGIPVDAIDLATVITRLQDAAANRRTLLLSTPNLNFLVNSLSDREFRQSLLDSDLCPPDGAPFFFLMIRRPPRSTLFPYTTLLHLV